jgi:hypothetical protein
MKTEFVTYEIALGLKELGFDEPCFGYYVDGELRGINLGIKELGGKEPYYQRFGFHVISNLDIDNATKVIIAAPTFSQAFRWFREKYELLNHLTTHLNPYGEDGALEESYGYRIMFNKDGWKCDVWEEPSFFDTYEEVELACIEKLIEIVKEKK